MRFFYDKNNKYELCNKGYKIEFYDIDEGVLLETFTDTLPHAICYLEKKYKTQLIEFK